MFFLLETVGCVREFLTILVLTVALFGCGEKPKGLERGSIHGKPASMEDPS